MPTDASGAPSLADAEAAGALNNLVRLAARLCAVPYSVVNIITEDQQLQIAASGVDPGVCMREDSMCAKVFLAGKTTVVQDASMNSRFVGNPFVTGEIAKVCFYASIPLQTAAGFTLGSLCVFSDGPDTLDAEQIAMLGYVELAEDVLDYSTVGGTLRRERLSLLAVTAEAARDLGLDLGDASGIYCDDAGLVADRAQLRALLQNLLANSLKYRSPERALEVSVNSVTGENGTTLTVADNGRGIDAADRQRAMEPLVRLNRAGDGPGSGLGLATCRRIAKAHGGELQITETPGGGTTISVLIAPL